MQVTVCGFAIPDGILRVARDERWTEYVEKARLPPAVTEAAFGEAPDSTWKFYGLGEMRAVTEEWHQEADRRWFGNPPHDIDPQKSVLVGELGYDRPFALDFRENEPIVRFMTIEANWIEVASSAEALLTKLGIEVES